MFAFRFPGKIGEKLVGGTRKAVSEHTDDIYTYIAKAASHSFMFLFCFQFNHIELSANILERVLENGFSERFMQPLTKRYLSELLSEHPDNAIRRLNFSARKLQRQLC